MNALTCGWNAGDNDRRLGNIESERARCPYAGNNADQWHKGYALGHAGEPLPHTPQAVWTHVTRRFETAAA
jgi:hypothetical protein